MFKKENGLIAIRNPIEKYTTLSQSKEQVVEITQTNGTHHQQSYRDIPRMYTLAQSDQQFREDCFCNTGARWIDTEVQENALGFWARVGPASQSTSQSAIAS